MNTRPLVDRESKQVVNTAFADINFAEIVASGSPCIVKAALKDRPIVQAAQQSTGSVLAHLARFANSNPLLCYTAPEQAKTRFFYNSEMNGLNFKTEYIGFDVFEQKIALEKSQQTHTSYYIGSAELNDHFPGLLEHEKLVLTGDQFTTFPPRVGIWLGNQTTAATHYDVSNNIAACLAGRRKFTLFPPEQTENLYPGPLERTPGGQVVSMFDLNDPDFDKFPRAKYALASAQVALLEPGDVLIYPAMWWHQVEATEELNVMVNYWWNTVPDYLDDPMVTLRHALLSLRDRPDHEKKAWQNLFDYYVFGDADKPRQHLPEHSWGSLAKLNGNAARRLRASLLKLMNR